MLTYNVQWVDITPNLAIHKQPVYHHERPLAHNGAKAWAGQSEVARMGKYWVPQTTLFTADKPAEWVFTHTGDAVRIPIWPFKTQARGEAAVWGLGLQVGMEAIASLRRVTSEVPSEVVLILSDRATDLYPENAVRCYVGIAIRTIN